MRFDIIQVKHLTCYQETCPYGSYFYAGYQWDDFRQMISLSVHTFTYLSQKRMGGTPAFYFLCH
jgi:hypothetical protein